MIFPPPNLTVFWVNLGSMQAPVGPLQYLRWLWCNSTEESSEKSTFCHFSSIHPFGRLWAFNCLLFSAGFWALIRPWRPFRDRIRQTVLVDTGTSGDQVSWSSAAVEKGLALDFRANKRSSQAVVLQGLPDLGLSKMSPVSSYLFLILCTWHIEGVCHLSSGSGLQPLDNQHFGLRVNLRHVVRGQVAVDVKVWCTGVLFIHTQELIDQLLVTGEALI